MKYRKLILIGLFILLLIDFGLIYQNYKSGQTPSYDFVTVKKGDIAATVSTTGTAEPASQINLQFTSSGRINDIKVKVGDQVSAGQVLISQDSSDLAFQAQSAQAALQSAQAKLAQLLAGASAEDIALAQTAVSNAQNNLDAAQLSFSNAQTNLDNVKTQQQTAVSNAYRNLLNSGTTAKASPTNISTVNPTISGTYTGTDQGDYKISIYLSGYSDFRFSISGLENGEGKANTTALQPLGTRGLYILFSSAPSANDSWTISIPDKTAANYLTYFNAYQTALQSQIQAIATAQAAIDTAQVAVTADQGALQTAQDQLALKLAKPRQTDIDLYQAQVSQAQANFNQIKNQISQKSLSAPIDGIITDVAFEKGEMASPTQTAISMNSLSNFEIKSDIAESDIAKIMAGDPVTITFDAFGDSQTWQGKVIKIDPAQTVIQGVVYYTTTVGLAGTDSKIKAGMTANLEIETDRHIGVLIIPLRAIQQNNNMNTVKLMQGTQIINKEVELGIKNDAGDVEIISGLSEGATVAIPK